MKKIGIIGQFPMPMHGLSKALDTLYNSYLQDEFNMKKFNITENKKLLNNIMKILFSNLDIYYLTISQSKFGNIRDLIIIKLIQIKKRKIVIHLHGGGFRNLLDEEVNFIQRRLNYKILSNVDAGIVLGKSLINQFENILPNERIYVVKNCVDNKFIMKEEEFSKKMNSLSQKESLNIVYLSNFILDKGYKEVLELAKLVKERKDTRFKFIFAGKFYNEKDKNEFFDYINDNNLHELITYKGIVGGGEKLNLLKETDIFILLTRYKNEGQPISIIEASVNGAIIITTNHAGIKDILTDKESIVCDKNNIDIERIYHELTECLSQIKVVLKNNRQKLMIDFSQENYLKNLREIFIKI